MQSKHARIVELLQSRGVVNIESLQRDLGVSARTVRAYIASFNKIAGGFARITHERGGGYTLEIIDRAAFEKALSNNRKQALSTPQTPLQRVYYLANYLLNHEGWVTIDTLAQELYFSRFTVSEDLKLVERIFDRHHLVLERRANRGIRVSGAEFDRRLCQTNIVLNQAKGDTSVIDDETDGLLERIAHYVDATLKHHELTITSIAYRNLLVHLAIAVQRLKAGHYIPLDERFLHELDEHPLHEAAQDLADSIGKELDVELPPEEVAYITLHLMGKQSLHTFMSSSGDPHSETQQFPEDIWNVCHDMVTRILEVFGFDLRNDFELRLNLARHILPLSIRLKTGMNLQNPLLDDIKQRYPLSYVIAQEAATVLAQAFGEPSDDEIGYIALAIALALQRQEERDTRRMSILVICATGMGSARLLEHRFRDEFGDQLAQIITADPQALESVDFTGIDCAFTTVPLARPLPIPIFTIGAFLDANEIPLIQAALNRRSEDADVARFFDPALFFTHLAPHSKAELIAFLCDQLRMVRGADDETERLVWQREEIAVTSFGNNVAMPHPIRPVVDTSIIAVALLDRPITWGPDKEVRAVFMVCISRDTDPGLQSLYRSLAQLMGSEEAITTLISQQSFESLLELLLQPYDN